LYLEIERDKIYKLRYRLEGEKGSRILYRTTNSNIGALLEKLIEVRSIVFCEC